MRSKIWSTVHRAGGGTVASVVGGLALALAALVILGLAIGGGTTSATDVTPKSISGNPDCEDLGHTNEKKVEPVVDGTFSLGFDGGTVTLVVDEGAKTFDWTSTLPINTVIVKGGPSALAYNYSPSSFGDDALHAPERRAGRFAGLSHVSFCFKKAVVNPTPTPKLITGNIAFEVNLNDGTVIPCTGTGEITVQTTKVVENEGSSSYTYDVSGLIDGTCTGLGAFSLSFEEGSQGACKGTEGAAGSFQCVGKNIVKSSATRWAKLLSQVPTSAPTSCGTGTTSCSARGPGI